MLKKIIIFIFTLVILFYAAGGCLLFYILQQANYRVMNRELKVAGNLEVIRLSLPAFNKIKEGKNEMKLNGKMYDIAKVEINDDVVTVYCMHDKYENTLLAGLFNFIKKENKGTSHPHNLLFKFFTLLSDEVNQANGIKFDTFINELFFNYIFPFPVSFFSIDTPPPKC